MRGQISKLQKELLFTLCYQVRVFSAVQLARRFELGASAVESLVQPLLDGELLNRVRLRARIIPPPEGPLAKWKPGERTPRLGNISYRAKERYRSVPVTEINSFVVTDEALSLFGAPPRKPFRRECADHDLGVSEMWLYAHRRWPRVTTRCWQGEDLYVGERLKYEKVEDARLVAPGTTRPWMVWEYAGSYRKDRVEAFHASMEELGLRYWIF